MLGTSMKQKAERIAERRKEPRYSLILRAGVLEQQGVTSFCLVKNISAAGVQLKVYSKPVLSVDASLRVGDEQAVAGRIAWIEGDAVGMNLHEKLDADTLLRVQQKLRAHGRRALPRMDVEASALLRTGGRIYRASIHDISSLGARLRTDVKLQAGDRAVIELSSLPSIKAYVRWAAGDELGLAFETPIPMQILSHWTQRGVKLIG